MSGPLGRRAPACAVSPVLPSLLASGRICVYTDIVLI